MKINPIGLYSLHQTTNHTPPLPKEPAVSTAASYDTIQIQNDSRDTCFQKTLAAHIWTDVRRGASAGKLEELTGRIRDGSYRPDASAIADKILLTGIIPDGGTENDHE